MDVEAVPSAEAVLALEEHMAATWPPLEQEWMGRWLLRAGGGWTGRANSALPLGEPGGSVGDGLEAVSAWYGARGLTPMVAVPLPALDELAATLTAQGWVRRHGALVLVAPVGAVLADLPDRDDLPPVDVAEEPDDDWLASYHYRGGALPDHAVRILRGGDARFASVRSAGRTLAIGRFVVAEGRVGITAMEVADGTRRSGLGAHVLRAMVRAAADAGATGAWLQVDPGNTPARALYARAGFTMHHTYRYHARETTQP